MNLQAYQEMRRKLVVHHVSGRFCHEVLVVLGWLRGDPADLRWRDVRLCTDLVTLFRSPRHANAHEEMRLALWG